MLIARSPCAGVGSMRQASTSVSCHVLRQRPFAAAGRRPERRTPAPRCALAKDAQALEFTDDKYKTFTNTAGRVLLPVADGVWAADRPFTWNKIDVARWALDGALEAALACLGPVRHIVSPNYEHIAYAAQWQERFPAATAYACPGLKAKEPRVFGGAAELGGAAPPQWQSDVEPLWLSYEANPFTGQPFFNEVVLLFRPARALVTSDLFWNYPRAAPGGTQLWKFGMDQVYRRFYKRFMIKDGGAYEAAMRTLDGWDWDAIVPCHGEVVRAGGKRLLRAHLGRA